MVLPSNNLYRGIRVMVAINNYTLNKYASSQANGIQMNGIALGTPSIDGATVLTARLRYIKI